MARLYESTKKFDNFENLMHAWDCGNMISVQCDQTTPRKIFRVMY